jgi:uncharacterized protein YtpQ (UPF0354 family)
LFLCGCSDNPDTNLLTAEEFSNAFVTRIKLGDAGISVKQIGELELRIDGGQKDEHSVFLDNAYKEYSLSPETLDDVLNRYVQSTLETIRRLEDKEVDIARVVPVIKDAAYPAEIKKSLIEAGYKTDKIDFYYEPLNEELLVFYALDAERNIKYLGREEIEALELKAKEIRERAVKNLSNLLPEIERQGGAGTFMVTAGGTYEASLLLFDSIWTRDNFSVKGDIVIAIPSRDLLLVTGSRDVAGLKRLRALAEETVEKRSYHLTAQLFVRRDGKWLPFNE